MRPLFICLLDWDLAPGIEVILVDDGSRDGFPDRARTRKGRMNMRLPSAGRSRLSQVQFWWARHWRGVM
ncbi:hypothetical protein EBAPG3_14970 [Nitrosospira lacus]|uniref:Uncharacterized protein n=2 Tax=Nitrosospira lacus TaxID=1288494 RepID=A0A1W6SKY4_9PROT|nr:hypothetical protein [Nitrosospira lacus]ASL24804.1 hypothetical protein EBAPG3_14970 [Nitrosospira lacus]